MNTIELLKWALEQKGYDGLCNSDWKCACKLEELIACGEDCCKCLPAYKHSDGLLYPEPEQCDGGCRL